MKVSWELFKDFVSTRSLSIQWLDLGTKYWMKAFDGNFELECELSKSPSDVTDLEDFEDNFKDNGNKSPKAEVITLFEKDDKTLKLICGKQNVDINTGLAAVRIKIPGTFNGITIGVSNGRWIDAGEVFFNAMSEGDKVIAINAIDVDNVLGLGANTILQTYHDSDAESENQGWFIANRGRGSVAVDTIGGYGWIASGFYLEIIGKKAEGSYSGTLYANVKLGK